MNKLLILILALNPFVLADSNVPSEEKDKILYMIFENQSKKIAYDDKSSCKKAPLSDWRCGHQIVTQFLMDLYQIHSTQAVLFKSEINCQQITPEMQKEIENKKELHNGPLEFRREIRQSLKDQWVCRFLVERGTSDSEKEKLGLAFIMNRDKSRIVSRRFAAWKETVPAPEKSATP